jgi:Fe-S cluster assembly protein SufD
MSAVLTYPSQIGALIAEGRKLTAEGPAWLRALRARALEIVEANGIPTPKNEEWKYTPLRDIADRAWEAPEPGPAVFDFELPFVVEKSLRIVLVNGRLDRNLSDFRSVPGLTITSLFDALNTGDALEGWLGQAAKIENHLFAALNTALFRDGVVIRVARAAMIEPVIEIVHVVATDGQVSAPRILIIAEEGSAAKIVERYVSATDEATLNLPVTESFIAADANIEHIRVQDESESANHIGLWEARQDKGSTYLAYNVAYGGRLARLDHSIYIAGEHATTRLDGVAVAHGEQLIDNHTNLDHAVPNCNSFEVYKQIIDDHATIVFNGKILVYQDAQKTDAKQTNQALLLSPNATINSKPQLEIFADDVKCTHGATVGQLEEIPLFYLMSRGMPRAQAESILVYAFAAEVLELISIAPLKDDLERRLFEKLAL